MSNMIRFECQMYKAARISEDLDSASKTWRNTKIFMELKTAGTPHQIEVNGKLVLKCSLIAKGSFPN